MSAWDAVVVGAGPAGAMAAHGLARRGVRVLLLDRATFPRWKVCGACVSAGSREVLEAEGLGGLLDELGGHELRRLRLHTRARSARVALPGSVAVSRSAFDAALVDGAVGAGATFWSETRVSATWLAVEERQLRIVRGGVESVLGAKVIVDATGLGGGVRGEGSCVDAVADGSRIGLGAVLSGGGYPVEPGELHMAVAPWGYAGLVRLEDGTLDVAAALDPETVRGSTPAAAVSSVLAHVGLPPVPERALAGWRGTPLLTRASADVGARRLFRVGDAAGYVEPFTGEGICWALSAGRDVAGLAASAVEHWSDELLERWRRYRADGLGRAQRLCRVLVGGLRRSWLVDASVAALAWAPALAAPFVTRASRAPAALRA